MENFSRINAEFVGLDCNKDGFEMLIKVNSDTYHALRHHLALSAAHNDDYLDIEEALNLRQSLEDAWNEAKYQYDHFDDDVYETED